MSYTTPTGLKNYLGVTAITDDALFLELIARAQKVIDNYTGRIFEAAADTTRYFTVGVDTEDGILYFDEDCCSITTVITNADASSPTTLSSTTDYFTHPRNRTPYYAVELLGSSLYTWTYTSNPEKGISVAGRWSYSTTAPADIVHACIRLAGYFYRQRDAGTFDTTAIPEAGIIQVPQGIPRDVKLILDPYRKSV